MSTSGLLRTNNKLTGNIKISVSSDGTIYLNSIDANKELADSRFKKIRINPNSTYSSDIKKFFDNGRLPTNIIFETFRTTDDLSSKRSFSKHYENQYCYGVSRCNSNLFPESYCAFAPIWLGRKIPRYFVVFKNPKARAIEYIRNPELLEIGRRFRVFGENTIVKYGIKEYTNNQTFVADSTNGGGYIISGDGYVVLDDPDFEYDQSVNPKNLLDNFVSPTSIVKIFDLGENTNIGKYLRKHINDPLYNTNSVSVNFENREIVYNGIDIRSGVMSDAGENIYNITDNEFDILDFDEYITQGFERNRLLSANILNMEFMFDDTKSDPYTFNRYFGLYVDDEELGRFFMDGDKMFSKEGLYRNPYYDKDVLPKYYGKYADDENGIKIIPEEIRDSEGYIFRKEDIKFKPSFYYIKDKRGGFHKLNNKATGDHYTLMDTRIDTELLFGFSNNHFEFDAVLPTEDGRSSMYFTINQGVETGYSIEFFYDKISIGKIIADDLADVTTEELQKLGEDDYLYDDTTPYQEGESIGYYFYPTGTPEQVAKAITGAIDYLLRDVRLDATYNDNVVFVRSEFTGSGRDKYRVELPENDDRITTSSNNFKGGTDTFISRVRVDIDLPEDVTEDSFLATTDGGFAKIRHISPYMEEPIFGEDGEISGYNGIESYVILNIVDEDKQIKIEKGVCSVYNKQKTGMGVFSMYPLRDFDFDTLTSSYNTGYNNEYKKYFKFPDDKLQNGEYYANHKLDNATADPILEYDGLLIGAHTGPIIGMDLGGNNIELDEDLTSIYTAGTYVRIFGSDGNDNFYLVDSSIFAFPTTTVVFDGSTPLIASPSVLGNSRSVFRATSTQNYTQVQGEPIVVAEKYYDDEELKTFIGFSALDTGEGNTISGNFDPDDLKNKYELLKFDETRVEYNRLRENSKSKNALKSKIIPNINKWVLEDGNNIRDIEYRLNLSRSFGEMNFSPSFVDQQQQTRFFTHEWLYLSSVPEIISDSDLDKSTSYFSEQFDIDKLNDVQNDYFNNYFTLDDYILRLPISESTTQTETQTLVGIVGGTIDISINGESFKKIFDTNETNTVNSWHSLYAAYILDIHSVIVTNNGFGSITFTASVPGDPFAINMVSAGAGGTWVQSGLVENVGNRLLETTTQKRYTTFKRISEGRYETFFRGVRVKLLSNTVDYSGYKFSAILNFHKTRIYSDRPPFDVTIVENRNFKNITFVVDIIIDDYKVLPDKDGLIFGEYFYLYVMNSLKRVLENQTGYEFGIEFEYPDTSPVDLFNSGVFGNPLGSPSAFPTTGSSPVTSFKGYQMHQKVNMNNLPNVDTLKFDNSKFLLTDFFGIRQDGRFGRLIGLNKDGVIMITSKNPFHSASQYIIDRPNTIVGLGSKENEVQLLSSGFAVVQIPSLTAVGSYNPSIVHSGIYPLDDLTWFHEEGGNNVYKRISELLSFGSLNEIVKTDDDRYIKYQVIQNGSVGINNDITIDFVRPSVINRKNSLVVESNDIQFPEIPEQVVQDFVSNEVFSPVSLNRYGGNFIPKFRDTILYKNDKLQMAWGLYDVSWENADHNWEEFDIQNPKIKTLPFSRKLFDLNTKFDVDAENFGFISNMYHHKVSSIEGELMVLDQPRYPKIGEIAIDKENSSIFLGDFDAKFYKDYSSKSKYTYKNGAFGLYDIKTFLNTKLLQVEELITLESFNVISEDVGIDDPSYDIGENDLVYETRDNQIIFRLNIFKVITDLVYNNISNEFEKFVNEFNTQDNDFGKATRAYIETNITNLYRIRETSPYIKKYNKEQNVPFINTELNELLLLQQGYLPDRNVDTTKINELELVMKYRLNQEFLYSFAMRVSVGIGDI